MYRQFVILNDLKKYNIRWKLSAVHCHVQTIRHLKRLEEVQEMTDEK
jgi:hypothetical protein